VRTEPDLQHEIRDIADRPSDRRASGYGRPIRRKNRFGNRFPFL